MTSTTRREAFDWLTILVTFALGTATFLSITKRDMTPGSGDADEHGHREPDGRSLAPESA